MKHEFSAGFLFCGLGSGTLGFIESTARLGDDEARFINAGGVDLDPDACADFEYLTGGKATVADVAKMKPKDLRKAWGGQRPDAVFQSSPCKGFSGLLSKKSAEQEKYQAMNRLVLQGFFLLCETWKEPPPQLILENVPRITTRGAPLLAQVRQLLSGYGYIFNEGTHDCGEVGGLAQHRRRYLMVARRPEACRSYIYRPTKKRVKACGEVLGDLALPEQPSAGEMHKLPKLSWLNWVRLALIPAGGDWRDLPGMKKKPAVEPTPADESPTIFERDAHGMLHAREVDDLSPQQLAFLSTNDRENRFGNQYKVRDWKDAAGTVTGDTDIQEGAQSIADPRLAAAVGLARTADSAASYGGRPGLFGVNSWDEPMPTVTASGSVSSSNAVAAIADPRPRFGNCDKVTPWEEPVGSVTAARSPSGGAAAVADPRLPRRNGGLGVTGWDAPAKTVTSESYPSNGSSSVADPRLPLGNRDESRGGALGVVPWEEPAPTITGQMRPGGSNTPASVADPRIGLGHEPRRGTFGVTEWSEPAATVRGKMDVRQAESAIADPRLSEEFAVNQKDNYGAFGVSAWDEPAATVRGASSVRTSKSAVADPRLLALSTDNPGRHESKFHVGEWTEPAKTVTGARPVTSGGPSVADPRPADLSLNVGPGTHSNIMKVNGWEDPSGTVTGATRPGAGAPSVADPRGIELHFHPDAHRNKYAVAGWDEPAATVTGATRPGGGAESVADPRSLTAEDVALKCRPWENSGIYGVISWQEAAGTVTGSAQFDNGRFAVADPRKPPKGAIPVIIAEDGTWHRPLTTLELAVLQTLPAVVNGKPLKLAGKSVAKWRERIGNAVPRLAALAIGDSLLTALLAHKLGTWTLGSTGIWVRKDGTTEDEANAPYEMDVVAEVA